MTPDDESCLKRLEQLEEENRQLRRAAEDFGRLAERLSVQLIEERRRVSDRRREPRETKDRRRAPAPSDEHR
jgi:predicted RNase H-like nuclease (RuvC/YqgF family)